jgi:hypothetical protein
MMNVHPATAALDATEADPPRALVEAQLRMLTRLAEIGMEIAEVAGLQAKASLDGAVPSVDPGLTYARVARAVRMTIALQSRLLKELPALNRALVEARRRRVRRLVDQAIEAEHDDADEIERLSDEALEHLRDPDDLAELLNRPIHEVVALICKDLGLSPDWAMSAFSPPGVSGVQADNDLSAVARWVSAEPTDEGAVQPHGSYPDGPEVHPSSEPYGPTFSPRRGRRRLGSYTNRR